MLSGRFTFQNRTEHLNFPPDWSRGGLPRLWAYHLHYHEFLWPLPFVEARRVVLHWIAQHRCASGQVGWEPYPVSVRIATWCTLFLGLHRAQTVADQQFNTTLSTSLHEQAETLRRRLEWHLLGNHLFENAVALAVAGSCFAHPRAADWLRAGVRLLRRQLPEQILPDGGHFERSPMYHARILHGLRILEGTRNPVLRDLVRPYAEPAAKWLSHLTHPDGFLALFNDSTLPCSASRPLRATGPFRLPHSGYYGARTESGHFVVCDAGPIGPDYQPGHAHADLFSFELSLHGARVIVDTGVATYEAGALRSYCRSTGAHNTLEIAGQDQVEVWSAFRVGRRCRPRDVAWRSSDHDFELLATHDGYRHLPGKPTHTRLFKWQACGTLDVFDRVVADRPVSAVARLHLHPDCRLRDLRDRSCLLQLRSIQVRISWSGWDHVTQEDSRYCPDFGEVVDNTCLAVVYHGSTLRGRITIEASP